MSERLESRALRRSQSKQSRELDFADRAFTAVLPAVTPIPFEP